MKKCFDFSYIKTNSFLGYTVLYIGRSWYININPFHANVLFLYPLKASKNQIFSDVFRGSKTRKLAWKELTHLRPMFHLCTFCKHQENSEFLTFSGGSENRLVCNELIRSNWLNYNNFMKIFFTNVACLINNLHNFLFLFALAV